MPDMITAEADKLAEQEGDQDLDLGNPVNN